LFDGIHERRTLRRVELARGVHSRRGGDGWVDVWGCDEYVYGIVLSVQEVRASSGSEEEEAVGREDRNVFLWRVETKTEMQKT